MLCKPWKISPICNCKQVFLSPYIWPILVEHLEWLFLSRYLTIFDLLWWLLNKIKSILLVPNLFLLHLSQMLGLNLTSCGGISMVWVLMSITQLADANIFYSYGCCKMHQNSEPSSPISITLITFDLLRWNIKGLCSHINYLVNVDAGDDEENLQKWFPPSSSLI